MSAYQSTGGKSDYEVALGVRLRAARSRTGLSLRVVEEKSQGRWTAATVGTYERGERSVTVEKLAALAAFYGVPASALLPVEGDGEDEIRAGRAALAVVAKLASALGVSVEDLLRGAA